ncbi:MAG: RdgB/HAM1 family non-canonical purine NTP pyrophosphatase [Ruminococcus sp.]|nr:RdgB/HAM1 family non-canonical purine NTP pyrophosphatase [Ruminococcus sp.]
MKIVLASNNKNKLREVREILEPKGFEVLSLSDCNINTDIEENGTTFEENATIKAKTIYNMTKLPCIADDSGLEVAYLHREPGVYSHRYAGDNANDHDRCNLILSKLENVPIELREAWFVCAICYINSDGEVKTVRGTCEGYIGFEERGSNGFGYDPIFMYGGKSFAELSPEEKNSISHRSNALKKLVEVL